MVSVKGLYKMAFGEIRLNHLWIKQKKIPFFERVNFVLNKYTGYLGKKKSITYLRKKFSYDNFFTPSLLQGYPEEILDLHKDVDFMESKTVLDIGANLGQFAVTLSRFFPHLEIYSFEPNKTIFPLLKKNVKTLPITPLNFAISPSKKSKKFYYLKNKSAMGSFLKENTRPSYLRDEKVSEITIESISLSKTDIAKCKLPKKVDFIKIDVEGFEYEVLQCLKNIDFTYLFVEMSNKRTGCKSEKDVISLLESFYKNEKITVIHRSGNENSTIYHLLLKKCKKK